MKPNKRFILGFLLGIMSAFIFLSLIFFFNLTVSSESPSDTINAENIISESGKVCIMISNFEYDNISDTNSMVPTMDYGHHAVVTPLESGSELNIGDIIVYHSIHGNQTIHRVIKQENNETFIVRGDIFYSNQRLNLKCKMYSIINKVGSLSKSGSGEKSLYMS